MVDKNGNSFLIEKMLANRTVVVNERGCFGGKYVNIVGFETCFCGYYLAKLVKLQPNSTSYKKKVMLAEVIFSYLGFIM